MRSADFERLYDEHAAALLTFLELRVGKRAIAEDVLAVRGEDFGRQAQPVGVTR